MEASLIEDRQRVFQSFQEPFRRHELDPAGGEQVDRAFEQSDCADADAIHCAAAFHPDRGRSSSASRMRV
jgi:hypothetical protein